MSSKITENAGEPSKQTAVKPRRTGMTVADARNALDRASKRHYDLPSSASLNAGNNVAPCRHLNVEPDVDSLCLDCGAEVPPRGASEEEWQKFWSDRSN